MDTAHGIDIDRLRQLNNPGYIRTRLAVTYVIIFGVFAVMGALINSYILKIIPGVTVGRIYGTFLPPAAAGFSGNLIYEIIYNSVDIFKISFIILLAGFTYIAAFINRASAAVSGMLYGLYAALCVDRILSGEYYGADAGVILLVNITILRFLLLSAVIIFSCVTSELYSDIWKRFRNINSLLRSWYFWKYIIKYLIYFGYVILNDTAYRILLNIFV